MKVGDIKNVTLIINGDNIPQVGNKTWIDYKEMRIDCEVLSIESVKYDGRHKLNIKYKVRILGVKEKMYLVGGTHDLLHDR